MTPVNMTPRNELSVQLVKEIAIQPAPKGIVMIPDWKMDMGSMYLGIDQRLMLLEQRVTELEREKVAANEAADEKPRSSSSNSLFKKIFICIH
jgi:hypothetical protein